ncbi:MAG: protein-L-isoaspartate(D-aspartate) O-methyltransferase, partial [Planctomycetota bacterium]|nr:protein-L-isoaspartate(D-aspartate) O-methyltransferase [Planctomycetota bacterium]
RQDAYTILDPMCGIIMDMNSDEKSSKPLLIIVMFGLCIAVAAVCLWLIFDRSDVDRRQVASDEDVIAQPPVGETPQPDNESPADAKEEAAFAELRNKMVDRQLAGRDITDPRVLDAMRRIPRHEFVPDDLRDLAYIDRPLQIGHKQTISQPYIVALMTQLAGTKPASCALDIGTGSGYQAAVLGELVEKVHSIEIVRPLADSARKRLAKLGCKNIEVIHGDGYRGLPQKAPFDLIIVAAAPDHVPEPLVEQLAPGGCLVIPVGSFYQNLLVIKKLPDGTVHRENVAPVAFVPMTGEAREKRD